MKASGWAVFMGGCGIIGFIIGYISEGFKIDKFRKRNKEAKQQLRDAIEEINGYHCEIVDDDGNPLPDLSKMTREEIEAFMSGE